MADSEILRNRLREAERAVESVLELVGGDGSSDGEAEKDIGGAKESLSRWRRALEAGKWPERSVQPYPQAQE